MDLDKIPEANMLDVAKSARVHRRAVLGFVPDIGLPIVDYGDLARIDAFYLECQNYRDYYRDPYDRVHKPEMFKQYTGKCSIRMNLDKSVQELRQPIQWVRKRLPFVLPVDYKSYMNLGIDIKDMLDGRYSKESCNNYKR